MSLDIVLLVYTQLFTALLALLIPVICLYWLKRWIFD